MLVARRPCPVNYDLLCNQTVTVYRKQGDNGNVTFLQLVYKKAFLNFKKTVSVDKLGASEATSFLLVIPGDAKPVYLGNELGVGPKELYHKQAVYPGDKVILGEGPEITSADYWAKEFIPSKVTGLVVVKYADPEYWNGELVHTEAGG